MRVAVAVGVTIPTLGRIFFQINRVLTGNESVPIQITQCWFPGLAIPMLKYEYFFSNKIHGSNFIKQHSETVMV